MYSDVVGRDVANMPVVDIYSAGFPCQPWSLAGLGQGRNDKQGRGKIIDYIMEYIAKKLPKVAIMENVASITYECHKAAFTSMRKTLRLSEKYFVTWWRLDASKFGIPQHRPPPRLHRGVSPVSYGLKGFLLALGTQCGVATIACGAVPLRGGRRLPKAVRRRGCQAQARPGDHQAGGRQ